MPLDHVIKDISLFNTVAEWVTLVALVRSPSLRKFSAMAAYLAIDATFAIPLEFLLNFHVGAQHFQGKLYADIFWISFFLDACVLFLVMHQVFSEALSPLSGLRRMGLVVFRWIAATCIVIAAVSAVTPSGHSFLASPDVILGQISRAVDLMEICLLGFLALTVHPLGLSFRSRIFGIGLGFGLTASSDLIATVILQHTGKMFGYGNLIGVSGACGGIAVWAIYFLKSEPARQPVTLPVTSPLLRWNEIADALGHKGGQVVLEQPSFFLQDVERAVDRVLSKNALKQPRVS